MIMIVGIACIVPTQHTCLFHYTSLAMPVLMVFPKSYHLYFRLIVR